MRNIKLARRIFDIAAQSPYKKRICNNLCPCCATPYARFAVNFHSDRNGMLGKAVQFRHCPATVSAAARRFLQDDRRQSGSQQPLEPPLLREGNPAQAQVRRPVPCGSYRVPRGTEETYAAILTAPLPRLVLHAFSAFCLHPERRHR